MDMEIRIRNLDRLDYIMEARPNIVGLGDEGCFYMLPSPEDALMIKRKVKDKGLEFRLITPKAPQRHVDKIIDIIKTLSHAGKDYHLTVNDLGLLYACHDMGILPESVTMGRNYSKSLVDCAWHDHLLEDEDESTKRTMYQNYLSHKTKIDFYKGFGVNSIECNMVEKQEDSYRNFVSNSWKVNIHYGLVTVAFSRICQTAKYFKCPVPDCVGKCNEQFEIEMAQIWDKGFFEDMSEELERINPSFILQGNVLFRKNPVNLKDYELANINGIILNEAHFTNIEAMEDTIKDIKEVVHNV